MEYFSEYERVKKRPTLLTVLCILTFIGSGFSFLGFLFISFSKDYIPIMIEVMQNMNQPEELIKNYELLLNIPSWKFLFLALSYSLAIVGAAMMLKLNKVGFHLYIISQLALFCCKNLLIGDNFKMGFVAIGWSLLFVFLYGMFYKLMSKKNIQEKSPDPDEDE